MTTHCSRMPALAAVERKSEDDLLCCIGTERARFDREVSRLLAFPVRALVVESTWERIEAGEWRSKITPAAAMGSSDRLGCDGSTDIHGRQS